MPGIAELDALSQEWQRAAFDSRSGFIRSEIEAANDEPILERLTTMVDDLILIPGAGRMSRSGGRAGPPLAGRGFFPDYDCEIVEIEPAQCR